MVSEDIRGMIPDYVRGLLSAEDAQTVQDALATIPKLAADYESARRYYSVLNQLQDSQAPDDFLDRVNKGIDRKPLPQRLFDLFFKPLWIKIPVEFAGIAACLVAAIILIKPEFPADTSEEKEAMALSMKAAPDAELVAEMSAVEKSLSHRPSASRSKQRAAPASPEKQKNDDLNTTVTAMAAEVKTEQKLPPAREYALAAAPTAPPAVDTPLPEPLQSESAAKSVSSTAVDIGSIELAYIHGTPASLSKMTSAPQTAANDAFSAMSAGKTPSLQEGTPDQVAAPAIDRPIVSVSEILDSILVTYDSLLTVTSQNGTSAYSLHLSPDQLSSVSKELARSFSITSRLQPFDPLVTKKIKVTFSIKE